MDNTQRRPKRQGAKAFQICTRCNTRRQIGWEQRLKPDHQEGVYVCKFCKPRLPHDRYVNFDPVANRRMNALKNRYGITVEQYDKMLEDQGGGCAICGRKPKKNRLHVDHDHETGEVRGILCIKCNTNMEWLEEFHTRALSYLNDEDWTASAYVQGLITKSDPPKS